MTKAICENAVHRVFVRFSELTRTGALAAFEVVDQANRDRSRERGGFPAMAVAIVRNAVAPGWLGVISFGPRAQPPPAVVRGHPVGADFIPI